MDDAAFQQQAQQARAQAEAQAEAMARREQMLVRIMTPEARERLATVRLVNEARAAAAEDHFLQLAANGQLDAKVNDSRLKDVLEAQGAAPRSKITFARRTHDDDDW
ncbi:DNA-binding protein [Thecamonas trahens ATCC 50062]|uniref:DNA-binding protein n=1 Tax=Thecamonas trahens ATCC 50062 TaxID=461836 RepID=A0A0L0D443_THETB|nr:DNA-binding protein [Thecamonas trahens ATCC 50062]KNC46876.1 DNA-binding protein [Thecamonas trahens ATCC 50062]|eukprot:XP_013760149.1 DNA-binding protein [Thecamonas trahens ATCC 50062]